MSPVSPTTLFPTDPESHRSPFFSPSLNFCATASSPPCSSVRQSQYGRIDSTYTLEISGAVFSVTSLISTCLFSFSDVPARSHVILKYLRTGLNPKLLQTSTYGCIEGVVALRNSGF